MRYPLKFVSLNCRNRLEKVFPRGGIRDFSVVTHLDTSCHTFGPHWHTSRIRSCIDRQSPPCDFLRRN